MIKPVLITCGERTAQFSLHLDPGFVQDDAISFFLQNAQPPEPEVVMFMTAAVQPGDHVIDCGANVGFFSLLMSQYVGSEGSVLAIEPDPRNYQKFEKNLALNKDARIQIKKVALANRPGKIDFYLTVDSGTNSAWHNSVATMKKTQVQAVVLDDLWERDLAPKLIKMDIEGSEMQALRGARNLLALHPNFIVMEFNEQALAGMDASVADLRYYLHDFGYDLFILNPMGGFPTHVPLEFKAKVDRNNTNVLFSSFRDLALIYPEVTV